MRRRYFVTASLIGLLQALIIDSDLCPYVAPLVVVMGYFALPFKCQQTTFFTRDICVWNIYSIPKYNTSMIYQDHISFTRRVIWKHEKVYRYGWLGFFDTILHI